jgi:hypothetical protein
MASKLTARKVETAKPGKDREKDAKLIALACSKPPKGRARWTLRLLEKKSWNFHCRSRQRLNDRANAQRNILQPYRPTVLGCDLAQGQ